jgi:hypothetical protein
MGNVCGQGGGYLATIPHAEENQPGVLHKTSRSTHPGKWLSMTSADRVMNLAHTIPYHSTSHNTTQHHTTPHNSYEEQNKQRGRIVITFITSHESGECFHQTQERVRLLLT